MIPEDESRRIKANLDRLGVILPCPSCGNHEFQLEGYFNMSDTNHPGTVVMGGRSIPLIAVVCQNCGHFSLHALNAINR